MRLLILLIALATCSLSAFAQSARPSLAERSAQTEAVAKPYFEAYIARDWDRLEPLLDEQVVFDDATAHWVFGATGKQGKTVLMKALRETYAAIRSMHFFPTSQFASGEHMVFIGELAYSVALPDGLVVDTRMPFMARIQVRNGKVLDHQDTADYKPFMLALRQARQAAGKS